MPHPARVWGIAYFVLVLTTSGLFAGLGISPVWGFFVGGLLAIVIYLALEVRYRRQHPTD